MTGNEIIKALECCTNGGICIECPLFEPKTTRCISQLKEYTLDLFNRQKAEIEKLNAMVAAAEEHLYPLPFKTAYDEEIQRAKAEAIREFAEKLKQREDVFCEPAGEDDEYYFKFIPIDAVDDLVKEMVGEDDG